MIEEKEAKLAKKQELKLPKYYGEVNKGQNP